MNRSELTEENYVDRINDLSEQEWAPLFELIPIIEQTKVFGTWPKNIDGKGTIESPYIFPHISHSKIVDKFCSLVYQIPIVIKFDWMSWTELETFIKNKDFDFDTIDIPQKCKIITAIVRAERFCEGNIVTEFESGLILKILKSIENQIKWNKK